MFSLVTHTYAFHENLGIDDNKASQLYQTSPNDPAIVRWKNAVQSAISDMDKNKCFDIDSAISCQSLIATIISNCKSHPNTLLGCNDSRLPQYPFILQQALQKAEEERKKAEEERKKMEAELAKANALKVPMYALSIIEKCFSNPNSNTTFEVASPVCDRELLSLQNDCQLASSPYDYCTDERFVGYLKKNGITNSTATP
jgi:hypothetical protein